MAEKDSNHRILFLSITILLFVAVSSHLSVPILAHSSINDGSGSSPFSSPHEYEDELDHHHHLHDHDHGGCNHDHNLRESDVRQRRMLPEELAEEEDLKLDSSLRHHYHEEHHHHNHEEKQLSGLGLWVSAMGCSLLVSMASLICLILLPVLFLKGKPSKMVVDAMATFGAGAMLGDSFLHQLPHAFSGGHSHSHNHDVHDHEMSHSHSHSLQDLSVGLSVLFGIVLFLLVEKVVRYVEEVSRKGGNSWGHGHHHHRSHSKLKDKGTNGSTSAVLATSEGKSGDESEVQKNKEQKDSEVLRKRVSVSNPADAKKLDASIDSLPEKKVSLSDTSATSPSSLVFGYLNLFSDGVHNFTDGMALGSAFLLYGSVGGWSRTLFLLAHELPQEIGDFGILVHSGFTVSKALFFNFLSALVALIGTALALLLGKDPGQSSLIEGFTAGGFIYISVAGVLPEMNNGSTTFKNTLIQLSSLLLGMGVALCISLAE